MLIYKGKVKFEYLDEGHKYVVSHKVDGGWTIPEPVVGTTTFTGIINKPALMLWPMNEAIKYLKSLKTIAEKDFVDAARAHKAKSQYGKDAGKVGHGMVEALLAGKEPEKPSDDLLEAYNSIKNAFTAYREDFAPKLLHSEEPMYSLEHKFAGTVDDVSEIGGKVTITDYKTTNPSYYNPDGIYAENFAQLGAYTILVEEMLGLKVEDAQIVNLPKDGSDYKVKNLADMGLTLTDIKLYALHCLKLYEIHNLIGSRLKG